VESYTGFPEILDGRVKTLQPKIHAGILANRKLDSHLEEMKKLDFGLIDVVVVNLYPFQQTVAKPDVTLEDAVENIDIGGITLIRAAAKNFDSVAIICDPADYGLFVKEVKEKNGASAELRKKLAVKAFKQTRDYDKAISDFLEKTLQ
jgi:phosphoribosylaminoimidazolecarboxamide formyltransferase/IMP cyclohydrolase